VGGGVIQDKMQGLRTGKLTMDPLQELEELLLPVSRMAIGDDFALE
jgi:hypothetical protein